MFPIYGIKIVKFPLIRSRRTNFFAYSISTRFQKTIYYKNDMPVALLRREDDGTPRIIAYASKTLDAIQRNYSVTERECLSILWSIKKFRCYIEGDQFTVAPDHGSLQWLFKLKNPSGRLARWTLELQQCDFTVEYKRGVLHTVPYGLSRMYEDEEEGEITEVKLNEIMDRSRTSHKKNANSQFNSQFF